MSVFNKKMELKEKFEKVITEWIDFRDKTDVVDDTIETPYGKSSWVVAMCYDIWKRIITFRKDNKVHLKDVLGKDQYASGHIDYHSKFALYCAELVLEDKK